MKLKTLLKTSLVVGLFAFSTNALSAGVMKEMIQMKKQLNALNQSQTSDEFQAAAEQFIEYSKDAQHTMPKSVGDDQERFKGYQAGVQEVIDVVNQANEKAKAGNLAEAKEMIEQLDEMRKKYHKEYK